MLEAIAIVLLIVTAVTWVCVATPEAVSAWASFARDLDPAKATQHATLFAPSAPNG